MPLSLPLYEGVDWNAGISGRGSNARVSLFTREWIEILRLRRTLSECVPSPSLRGSGLKLHQLVIQMFLHIVSLFTREWIEIPLSPAPLSVLSTSPSLRGSGLKLFVNIVSVSNCMSPSLRGSGLKCTVLKYRCTSIWCLPLYEGVDWNSVKGGFCFWATLSPYLRGSGLKSASASTSIFPFMSPSLRGSGLKLFYFTEISHGHRCLPLYEGVDWNAALCCCPPACPQSPSLRGSGLKLPCLRHLGILCCLPLYEGVDWNNILLGAVIAVQNVSLFTREWIEILQLVRHVPLLGNVSLFTREWIEISPVQLA